MNRLRHSQSLITILDCARSRDNRQFAATDRGVADPHDCFLRAQIERNQLVRLGDADDFGDTREIFKTPAVDWAFVTSDTNCGARRARHRMRTQADCLNDVHHRINFAPGGTGFHHNQHMVTKPWVISLTQRPDLSLRER